MFSDEDADTYKCLVCKSEWKITATKKSYEKLESGKYQCFTENCPGKLVRQSCQNNAT